MARPFLAPFRRLLRLAGSRWRYSTPPSHGLVHLGIPALLFPNRSSRRQENFPNAIPRINLLLSRLLYSHLPRNSYDEILYSTRDPFTKYFPGLSIFPANNFVRIVRTYVRVSACGRVAYNSPPQLMHMENRQLAVSITVAGRCKASTVFARSNTGIVDSNPIRGMDVCVCVYSVSVLSSVQVAASRLADPPSKGPTDCVIRSRNLKSGKGPTKGCIAIEIDR
jgi:hypothetical protein